MCALLKDIKFFQQGGLNTDDAIEYRPKNDYQEAWNVRVTGTNSLDEGNLTNIESNQLLSGTLLAGLNNIIGGGKFDDSAQIVGFRYNTAGNNQIILYDYATNTYKVIYTDLTDSGNIPLLPLNPQNEVRCVLINQTYLIWWAKGLEVGYTNLKTLAAGGYSTPVLAEDLLLLKPQMMPPITGVYGSDTGQPANYLFGNLPQFNAQYINLDFNYSAWSTWSKRIVPYQQNTPTLGADVTQNNYITLSINIGSKRASTINIACRFGTDIFQIIKSVDRSYILALPNTVVDVPNQILEGYDPTTNIYQFAFYNNDISIPVDPTQTDLLYDYIWQVNAGENINGNIFGMGDLTVGYPRPSTPVTINAVGYDPNIDIPAGTFPDPLRITNSNSGLNAGNHKYFMAISYAGTPHTGDELIITLVDTRNAANTQTYSYVVPSAQDGDFYNVLLSFAETIPGSNYDGVATITILGPPYFILQRASVALEFSGDTVANSIPTILDNTVYQAALEYRDAEGGRLFPLDTDNTFIVTTPSYAQVNGQAVQITWKINNPIAPVGAVDYQWLLTKPPVDSLIDVNTCLLDFKGTWDAHLNMTNTGATLTTNGGYAVGNVYQITTPSLPTDTPAVNLGSGGPYYTGDYIVYNGQSWDILPKSFGDLTPTGNVLAFSLNPLNLFNAEYSNEGVTTVLGYDFSPGDRCTLHYYIDGSTKNFINDPCVNLSVLGYDSGLYILKVEKSATFDSSVLVLKNTFLRIYSPSKQAQTVSTTQNGTVWFEIGERFTITNGMHDTLSGILTDGGAYYKTRQYKDAIQPTTNPPIEFLATDFNYSDFYQSAFSSFGRPRTYNDELEQTERKASIITSQPYILGSRINGLNRVYPADIYGDGDGQTSSSHGAIQIMWQRGDVLVVIQELSTFYIPVNYAYTVLNDELTGQSISEKLLNNGRYDTRGIGIGLAKESFCTRYNVGYFVDPNKSLPMTIQINGIEPISDKMSLYFKNIIQLAYQLGKKMNMFYNDFYEEVILCIQSENGILIFFPFSTANWNPFNNYSLIPSDISATPDPSDATASYDPTTGIVTYTPNPGFVGNNVATYTFNPGDGDVTRNICLTWVAGNTNVNPFSFTPQTGVPLSTERQSNTILVSGNTVPSPISITGGQYSVNGGSFTTSPGFVNSGDNVQVQVLSSASDNTATSCTLTVGDQSGTFTVTTINPAMGGNLFISGGNGLTITGVVDVIATGIPSACSPIVASPSDILSFPYTTVTAGSVHVTVTGTAVITGRSLYLVVNEIVVDSVICNTGGTYTLTFPATVNDPTTISFSIDNF